MLSRKLVLNNYDTMKYDITSAGLLIDIVDIIWHSLKFLRDKHYIMVLPNFAQKQIFMDKVFMIKLPATLCICYELAISWEKVLGCNIMVLSGSTFYMIHDCTHLSSVV